MKFNKFNDAIQKTNQEIGSFEPFKGNVKDIFLAETLFERTSVQTLLKEINKGKTFKTAHLATKESLNELGLTVVNTPFFIFEAPTNFTKPVIIPE